MATTGASSGPVFVFIHSSICTYCHSFIANHLTQVKKDLVELHPDIRIESVLFKSFEPTSYDQNKYPKGLEFWGKFYPSFVLVPGDIWDRASKDKGVTMTIADGVEGMNLVFKNGELTATRGYNYDKTGVMAWATTVLAKSNFKAANISKKVNHTDKPVAVASSAVSVPIPMTTPNPTPSSIITDVIVEYQGDNSNAVSRPVSSLEKSSYSTNYKLPTNYKPPTTYTKSIVAVPAPTTTTVKGASYGTHINGSKPTSEDVGINVCSIRLISRPANR